MTGPTPPCLTERFRLSGEVLADERVVCFASGKTIPKSEASRVPLGKDCYVWISQSLCRRG